MCGCEWNHAPCSRCARDPRQDWRFAFEPDPAEERDDAERAADLAALLAEGERDNTEQRRLESV